MSICFDLFVSLLCILLTMTQPQGFVIVNWPNGLTKFQNMFLPTNCSHQNVTILLNSIQSKTLFTVLVCHNHLKRNYYELSLFKFKLMIAIHSGAIIITTIHDCLSLSWSESVQYLAQCWSKI